ncbi:uncharacterized protein B0J16DRAFT_104957 [Fusarium flagelliforme]|uniref:uncharacterized protein n=1 Tax=Fusarium flagelliforme TaxID=2675880 RepID=UPI001E8CD344|nr:uncharacterized protein B0J16DRAFT_104957 [Fusarium flagelliforme]KAH7188951.1 hypothetical protein B0J16DRAFT_104957 [Fusarium flagelliforme]
MRCKGLFLSLLVGPEKAQRGGYCTPLYSVLHCTYCSTSISLSTTALANIREAICRLSDCYCSTVLKGADKE